MPIHSTTKLLWRNVGKGEFSEKHLYLFFSHYGKTKNKTFTCTSPIPPPNKHTQTEILLRSMTCVPTFKFETSLQLSVIVLYETHFPLCSNWKVSVTELILFAVTNQRMSITFIASIRAWLSCVCAQGLQRECQR